MKSAILEAMLKSPALPMLIQDAQSVLAEERERRHKFYQSSFERSAEFIQGQIVVHDPVPARHLRANQRLAGLMDAFVGIHQLGEVYLGRTLTVFPRNDYEPDILFFALPKLGLIDPDTFKFPIPDLIVEILSPSSEACDRGVKFEDYALHGVEEYWIIDPVSETVEVYRLSDDFYPPVDRQATGSLSSRVVPGFTIPVRAIFEKELYRCIIRAFMEGN